MIQQIQTKLLDNLQNLTNILQEDNIEIDNNLIKKIESNILNYLPEKYFDPQKDKINNLIDYTYLKPDINYKKVESLVSDSLKNNFAAICIPPTFIPFARSLSKEIKIATVIGFPLGYTFDFTKFNETEISLKNGADEIDMVINISFLKENKFYYVLNEIKEIKKLCKDKILKVIIETCYLNFEEKVFASILSFIANADFIKTSTGFGPSGALLEDIVLMKMIFGERGVKASGGIKTLDFAIELAKFGATRIGTSSSLGLIN